MPGALLEDLHSEDPGVSAVAEVVVLTAADMHAAMERSFAEGAAHERRLIQRYLRSLGLGEEADALDFGAHRNG